MDSAPVFSSPTLVLTRVDYERMLSHSIRGLPDEACGLLLGPWENGSPTGIVKEMMPCTNADASAMTFTVDSKDMLRAMRAAEDQGWEIAGVWHSHTHTDAYPSPTDVRQAHDPNWIYVLVSLAIAEPVVRAYRIVEGAIFEIPLHLEP